jgi:hypothetical protein
MEPLFEVRFKGEVVFMITDTDLRQRKLDEELEKRGIDRQGTVIEIVLARPLINPNH